MAKNARDQIKMAGTVTSYSISLQSSRDLIFNSNEKAILLDASES